MEVFFSSVRLALHTTRSVNKLVQRHSHIFELNCNHLFNKEDSPFKCWLISSSLFVFSSPRSAELKNISVTSMNKQNSTMIYGGSCQQWSLLYE